jgi:mono/diheme cytochrome c family protein
MARQRWGKILGVTFVLLLISLSIVITFTIGWRPIIGPRARALTDRKLAATPERLARGQYLVDSVMGCIGCHSDQDLSKPGGPPVANRRGAGLVWAATDTPWLVAPNITPDKETGAGNWSDDALARAIREGIGHDGRALFPIMPYPSFRSMSDEDLASVIVYIRSLPAVRNQLPATKIPFPLNFLTKDVPQPLTTAVPPPDQATAAARGAYLVRMGTCADCHTPQEKGKPVAGMDFAGGLVLKGPTGTVASSNITPDASAFRTMTKIFFSAPCTKEEWERAR